jgi:hypothetical protein
MSGGLSIHSAAQNSLFSFCNSYVGLDTTKLFLTTDQLSLLRALLAEDPKLINVPDAVIKLTFLHCIELD